MWFCGGEDGNENGDEAEKVCAGITVVCYESNLTGPMISFEILMICKVKKRIWCQNRDGDGDEKVCFGMTLVCLAAAVSSKVSRWEREGSKCLLDPDVDYQKNINIILD